MNAFYDDNMLYVPMPNLIEDILANYQAEDDDYPYDENTMEFTPLPNFVGKIEDSDSDDEEEQDAQPFIESWAKPEIIENQQQVLDFDKIEEEEQKQEEEEHKEVKLYHPPVPTYSYENKMQILYRDDDNDNTEKSIVLGQKEQPEIIQSKEEQTNNDINIEPSNTLKVSKINNIKIEIPQKKVEDSHKSVKVDISSDLPELKFTFKNQIDLAN